MRILLVSANSEVEQHSYTSSLTKVFSELGHEVLHYSQSKGKPIKIKQALPTFFSKSKLLSSNYYKVHASTIKRWQTRKDAIVTWQLLFDYIKKLQNNSNRPDVLFFESLDATIGHFLTKKYIENKLILPFSGILVCPEDTRLKAKSFLRRGPFDPYSILKSRCCKSVGVVVEDVINFLSMLIHKPVILLPDVISIPECNRNNSLGETVRARAGGRFIIGSWGCHTKRKGISEFLQMCLRLPSQEYFFIIGGRINEEGLQEDDRSILQKCRFGIIENLMIVDKWLADNEFLSGMLSCDLIFAAYPDWKFSSGIIGQAATVGVPILVNDGFVMAKRVRDFNIGFVKDNQIDSALWVSENVAAIKKMHYSDCFKSGCSEYCEKFGYKQWRKSLAHLIEPCVNPPNPK